jgi:hypothetical protein
MTFLPAGIFAHPPEQVHPGRLAYWHIITLALSSKQPGIMIMPMFNISSSLQISGSYQYATIDFPDREKNNKLNIHTARLKTLVMLNTKLSASVLVQYVNTQDDLIANFRLRYNPREGNDFYLVYNEYRGIGIEEYMPALPNYYNRTILLKYTHTFRL